MNGTIESTINIRIAKNVEKKLKKLGYKTIMTRKTDDGIYSVDGTIMEKKRSDMQNRLKIINSSGADMLVSIHMNKFTDSRYSGAQVLYSSNFLQSQTLAEEIQKALHKVPENKTKRTAMRASDKIFLLKNAKIPAVLVECGFLSNFTEEQNLNNENYRNKISSAIVDGILSYYNNGILSYYNKPLT